MEKRFHSLGGHVNDSTDTAARHRVVIVGSGFGGLFAAKALKRADVDVTMIARTNHHLFQPLLYQVATGILSQGEIAPPTREILRRQRNAQVLLGEVTDINVEKRIVTSWTPWKTRRTPYDSVILAAGSSQSYFGNEQFAEFAPGMKSIDDALELRGRILGAFEFAELETDPEKVMRWLTFVIVGAGPTGVEMAGQIAELSRRTLRRDFRNIDPSQARIVLLDAAPQMLGNFGDRLSAKAQHELEKLGVEVQLGAMVVGVDEDGIEVKDTDGTTRRIESWCKVWAAGVAASPLGRQVAQQTGAKVDKAGRVYVEPDCTLPGHPEVFVIGDMIAGGLPGVAQVAMQSGRHAAKLIKARVAGRDARDPFEYFDKGSMATISRFDAVASIGKLRLSGFLAWLAWLVIHLFYLIGFKQRVTTLLHWSVSFVGRGRAERTVTRQQIVARRALDTVDPNLSGRPERVWPPQA
jgi:NADH:ubiquinone reductase (H+-translocating)